MHGTIPPCRTSTAKWMSEAPTAVLTVVSTHIFLQIFPMWVSAYLLPQAHNQADQQLALHPTADHPP
jgi:hypothetical protein